MGQHNLTALTPGNLQKRLENTRILQDFSTHMLHGAGIWVIFRANVGKYSIHGASGLEKLIFPHLSGEDCWILCQLASFSSAGPQLQARDHSGPCRTRTASPRSECSSPDLDHKESSKI